jgi:hypothetical protein
MWLAERLKERSTWLAILAIAGLFGIQIEPELRTHITDALMAIAAIVAFLFRENERQVNIQLPPIEMQSKPSRIEVPENHITGTEYDERQGWNG